MSFIELFLFSDFFKFNFNFSEFSIINSRVSEEEKRAERTSWKCTTAATDLWNASAQRRPLPAELRFVRHLQHEQQHQHATAPTEELLDPEHQQQCTGGTAAAAAALRQQSLRALRTVHDASQQS